VTKFPLKFQILTHTVWQITSCLRPKVGLHYIYIFKQFPLQHKNILLMCALPDQRVPQKRLATDPENLSFLLSFAFSKRFYSRQTSTQVLHFLDSRAREMTPSKVFFTIYFLFKTGGNARIFRENCVGCHLFHA
jgi:hypothetical protein